MRDDLRKRKSGEKEMVKDFVLVPFKEEHLTELVLRPWAARDCEIKEWIDVTLGLWRDPGGAGYSLLQDGRVLAVGLVIRNPFSPIEEGLAALHTSAEVEGMPLAFTRAVRECLSEMVSVLGLRRVFASVIVEWAMAQRWIQVLGFQEIRTVENPYDRGRKIVLFVREFERSECHKGKEVNPLPHLNANEKGGEKPMKRHEEFHPNIDIDLRDKNGRYPGTPNPDPMGWNDGVTGPTPVVPGDPGGAGTRQGPFTGGDLGTGYPGGDLKRK